jgi:hypothetical protein
MALDLSAEKKRILAEIKRRGGAAKAPGFSKELSRVEMQMKAANDGKKRQTAPKATTQPAPAPKKGVVGDNFKLGDTDARLQQQLERAQSEIQRRGGTAPNNEARVEAIKAAQASRGGQGGTPGAPGMSPPLQAPPGGSQPGQPTPPGMSPPQYTPGGQSPYQNVGNTGLPGMYSQGSNQGQPPQNTPYQYQNQGGPSTAVMSGGQPQMMPQNGQSQLQGQAGSIYDQATGGTLSQFDTAANRLRERLDASTEGQLDAAKNRNIGRGFGQSGMQSSDAYKIGAGAQNAYAQGLNDLSGQFEAFRQKGLETGLGATRAGMEDEQSRNALGQLDASQIRNIQNSNYQFGSGQDQQNRQFMDTTLFNLINGREGRGSAERIASNDVASRDRNAAGDRSLQEGLGQLNQQNTNWRASLENLFRIPGLFDGSSAGSTKMDLGSLLGGMGSSSGGSTSGNTQFSRGAST